MALDRTSPLAAESRDTSITDELVVVNGLRLPLPADPKRLLVMQPHRGHGCSVSFPAPHRAQVAMPYPLLIAAEIIGFDPLRPAGGSFLGIARGFLGFSDLGLSLIRPLPI